MIIVPAVLIMIVTGIVYLSYMKIAKGAWGDDGGKSIVAQSMIAEYSNRMQYSQSVNNLDKLQSELQKHLLESGIYSTITRDNQIVASNFTKEVKILSATMDSETISMPKSFILQSGHALLIRYSFQKDSNLFTVTGINPNYIIKSIDLETRIKVMGTYITIIFVLSLLIIAVTNGVISAKTLKISSTPQV